MLPQASLESSHCKTEKDHLETLISRQSMSDPFEQSKIPLTSTLPSPQLRERSIQQAVDFLNDPRVKTSHPGKALDFLRQKGITDDELREAYRRCRLSFPSATDPGHFMTPQHAIPPQYAPQQPTRSSWMSVFLGITAAAGIYTAIREILRRYIVPLYFPDAARIADERRRRAELSFQTQERQIEELRERIQDLVASSDRTSDRMERLSKSMSSSIALRERELSETSQLRSAIQQLSHSVTMSAGTSPSRGLPSSSTRPNNESHVKDKCNSKRQSSSSYSGVVETSELRNSTDRNTNGAKMEGPDAVGNADYQPEEQVANINGFVSSSIRRHEEGKADDADDEDEFMAIQPAEIEGSWKKSIDSACESSTSARSTSKVKENEIPFMEPSEQVDNAKLDEAAASKETEDGLITKGVSELPLGEDELGDDVVRPAGQASSGAVARQLFRFEMMQEADNVLSHGKPGPSNRVRPTSMPQLDTPLSDTDP